jgi:hypothetical protein
MVHYRRPMRIVKDAGRHRLSGRPCVLLEHLQGAVTVSPFPEQPDSGGCRSRSDEEYAHLIQSVCTRLCVYYSRFTKRIHRHRLIIELLGLMARIVCEAIVWCIRVLLAFIGREVGTAVIVLIALGCFVETRTALKLIELSEEFLHGSRTALSNCVCQLKRLTGLDVSKMRELKEKEMDARS